MAKKYWIQKRANCTLQNTFDKILSVIEIDVERVNQLEKDLRKGREFEFCKKSNSNALVKEINPETKSSMLDIPNIHINLQSNRIEIREDNLLRFVVKQKWNTETLDCDLKMENAEIEECSSIYQISQRAIGDYMFLDVDEYR